MGFFILFFMKNLKERAYLIFKHSLRVIFITKQNLGVKLKDGKKYKGGFIIYNNNYSRLLFYKTLYCCVLSNCEWHSCFFYCISQVPFLSFCSVLYICV